MSRHLLFAIICGVIGLATWEIARRGARAYEGMLVHRVTNGLEVLGYDWARIEADGLKLELHGHAPDTFARELALESARATAPNATVTSFATATLAPPAHRDPVRVELHRDQRGVTMTGQTASRAMRQRVNAALTSRDPAIEIHDLTGIQAAPPPRGWGPEIEVATLAVMSLPNAYVVMEPGAVLVDGQAIDRDARELLRDALHEAAGGDVALTLRLRIPAQVIAPFVFEAEKEPGRGIRLETCAVRSEEEQAVMTARLTNLGPRERLVPCKVGLGGPGGDWLAAINAGLDALELLPAGRLEIEYRTVRLSGHPPTPPPDFDAAGAVLAAGLPEGFMPKVVLHSDDVATRIGIARDRYWLSLGRSAEGVTIAGQVPDRAAEIAITAYASAIFGRPNVQHRLSVTGAAPPADWQIAAMALLDQLALSDAGEARMAGYAISLRARLDQPVLARQIHHELAGGLPRYNVETVFEMNLADRLAAIPLPGVQCAARLNLINRERPIDFKPGSARIAEESVPALDALSAVFRRCNSDRIEIGGHTDSQGSDELNLRLSQARADAVVTALVNRGVTRARLAARGYGETVPIADNETEEGRARNRRIEFLARPAPAAEQDG